MSKLLTQSEAADILGYNRGYFASLCKKKIVPFRLDEERIARRDKRGIASPHPQTFRLFDEKELRAWHENRKIHGEEIPPGYISVEEAAKRLGILPKSLLRASYDGRIQFVKSGRHRFFKEQDVAQYRESPVERQRRYFFVEKGKLKFIKAKSVEDILSRVLEFVEDNGRGDVLAAARYIRSRSGSPLRVWPTANSIREKIIELVREGVTRVLPTPISAGVIVGVDIVGTKIFVELRGGAHLPLNKLSENEQSILSANMIATQIEELRKNDAN